MNRLGRLRRRSGGLYVRARRVGEKRIFSPTQSLRRLTASRLGRIALPPSHPHAATSAPAPPAAPSLRNARRSTGGVLVMTWKAPAIPACDHRRQRVRVHEEHERHVHRGERYEDPHRPEVPVARRLEAAEQRGEPAELHRLVDGEPGQHGKHAEQDDESVRELLQGVVLALRRMLPAETEIVLLHLDRPAQVPRPEHQSAPLAACDQVGEIQQPTGNERPHQREVPVQGPGEPAAQPAPGGELRVVEGAREVRAAAVPEARVRFVDLQPARDHTGKEGNRGPMRQPDDPVVALHARPHGRSHIGRGGGRDVAHRSNIFPRVRYVIVLALVAACQLRPATKSTHPADTLDLSRLVPRLAQDSALLVPRVVTGPSVVLFWLPAADTLSAADQAQAFDDLKNYTEQVAPTLAANGIELLSTNSDTAYVALPNKQRRAVLLSGLDYPFGYLLVDPGGPERILTGVYEDAELLDELRAYFDLADDSLPPPPPVTT